MADQSRTSSESLASFLVRMAEDPRSLMRLNDDPGQVLDEANLIHSDEEALRSGDAQRIERAIMESLPGSPRVLRDSDAFKVTVHISATISVFARAQHEQQQQE